MNAETQIGKLEPQIPLISQISRRLLGDERTIFSWQSSRASIVVTYFAWVIRVICEICG
jgi:hypothetical protein